MTKLQSMTDYVLEQKDFYLTDRITKANVGLHVYLSKTSSYANFLKLNLEKWMFIPCDSDGNVFEEPNPSKFTMDNIQSFDIYQQAKENVIFKEGFTYVKNTNSFVIYFKNNPIWVSWNKSKTIENLIEHDLTLTDNTIKKYKL